MASETLSISDPTLLAEYVRQSDLKTFFERRLATPPDQMALLIRNGEVIQSYKGAHFSIGGLVNGLKSVVGGSTHIQILLADLKPFAMQTPVKALSKDNVEIAGVCTLEMQVNPDKPSNVMGLMNPGGFLTRDEVLERFRPHLTDRVFEAAIGRINAEDIRGDKGLQDYIQGDVMREIERIAGNIGLIVNSVSMEWALNAAERDAMKAAEIEREQDKLDHQLTLLRRNVERTADSREIEIRSKVDLARLANESEDELTRMAMASEIELLDAREAVARRQELEVLQHEITVLKTERVAKFENQLAEAGQTIDLTKSKADLRKVEREIADLDHLQSIEFRKREAEISQFEAFSKQDIANRAQQQAADHIRTLQDIENQGEDANVNRKIRTDDAAAARQIQVGNAENAQELARLRAEADARVAQLQAGAKMSPEQILAINAGLSADVAGVLAEQAKAKASGTEETMSVMRDMVQAATDAQIRSEEQARAMFGMGMDGVVGVSHGAGGGEAPASSTPMAKSKPDMVECSKCGRENSPKARFCIGCGNKLRA
ncbi:MAG: zinc-ribbon domain-containing protein [Pseudomonadota bacterium]